MNEQELKQHFSSGGVLAYPTEGVFGLGCDPDNEAATLKICELKQREVAKGVILISDQFERVAKYVDQAAIPPEVLEKIFASWPGPVTWLLPKSDKAPKWVTGDHAMIAIRVSANKTVKHLCELFGSAMVSTSANLAGQPSAMTYQEVKSIFADTVYCVEGETDGRTKPSDIFNSLTGEQVRG